MSTNSQNAANAQFSTGPRTEAGKAISSRNSLKHGLTAKTVLLPGEDPAEYQILRDGMFHDFDPLNTTEAALVSDLVDLQWRLRRVSSLEARILSAESPDFKALDNISLHASRIKRQYSSTLKDFQQLRPIHIERRKRQIEDAITVYQADRILNRPSTHDEFGFDFTLDELVDLLRRRAALKAADDVITARKYPFAGGKDGTQFPTDKAA